jgi:phosphatidylserine/phosphatidylglycerophosphate/cardiolipin synthase-like enzyme
VHHKFIVINAEGDDPAIFTGSANMSNNAQYNNDENLLQIKGSKELAACYLAEFLRLYEQYRWIHDARRADRDSARQESTHLNEGENHGCLREAQKGKAGRAREDGR